MVFLLILIGAGSRLITLPHGLSLTVAMILLAAAYLDWKRAMVVALGTMILGDALTGFHSMIPWTWTGALLMAQVAWMFFGVGADLRVRPEGHTHRCAPTYPKVAIASIISLTVFHLWSNFGVWVMGNCLGGERMYSATLAGLIGVYQAGWSYYLYSIGGNLIITTVAFVIARKLFGISVVGEKKGMRLQEQIDTP